MSHGDPVTNLTSLREQLALDSACIAINAGSWGPLCLAAVNAMNDFDYRTQRERVDWIEFAPTVLELLEQDRIAVAKLIGAKASEIALCDSTTQALNIVLWGLNLKAGDEIVYTNLENPAAEIPLWNLAQRKGVRLLKAGLGLGEVDEITAVEACLSKRTKVFLVSDINYATGARFDLPHLSELARHHDVFLLVDGVQAVGTIPVNVGELGVDAYALARHKFLCGPDGAGALFVRDHRLGQVHATFSGVCSTTLYSNNPAPKGTYMLRPTAERYEVSTRSFGAYVGGQAALKWLAEEVTLPFVYDRTSSLRRLLWDLLSDISGVELISQRHWDSGLLTFRIAHLPADNVVERLRQRQIHSRTIDILPEPCVRLSIGFWNRDSDINIIASVVRDML